ncbi:hypothetical protein COO60DRAFT_1637524 [Scenedesmus sp. NREL 46B-D3]|nr:hypothetical protein COO60DRAFT_1637524 [Scenedesmus sp. NREL 46B-D3]
MAAPAQAGTINSLLAAATAEGLSRMLQGVMQQQQGLFPEVLRELGTQMCAAPFLLHQRDGQAPSRQNCSQRKAGWGAAFIGSCFGRGASSFDEC